MDAPIDEANLPSRNLPASRTAYGELQAAGNYVDKGVVKCKCGEQVHVLQSESGKEARFLLNGEAHLHCDAAPSIALPPTPTFADQERRLRQLLGQQD